MREVTGTVTVAGLSAQLCARGPLWTASNAHKNVRSSDESILSFAFESLSAALEIASARGVPQSHNFEPRTLFRKGSQLKCERVLQEQTHKFVSRCSEDSAQKVKHPRMNSNLRPLWPDSLLVLLQHIARKHILTEASCDQVARYISQ